MMVQLLMLLVCLVRQRSGGAHLRCCSTTRGLHHGCSTSTQLGAAAVAHNVQAYELTGPVTSLPLEIKKSKFIARASPCASVDLALAKVDECRRSLDPKARHWCWAWRGALGSGESRCSDDGEPASTAGKPILAAIEGEGLYSTCIVVTRYFGGIELGTGGLVRAYGQSARDALLLAQKAPIQQLSSLRLRFSTHEDASRAYGLIGRTEQTRKLRDDVWEDDGSVVVSWEVLKNQRAALAEQVIDLTKGRATLLEEEEEEEDDEAQDGRRRRD